MGGSAPHRPPPRAVGLYLAHEKLDGASATSNGVNYKPRLGGGV